MAIVPHARDDGLSRSVGLASQQDALIAIAIVFAIAWLALSFGTAFSIVVITLGVTAIVGLLALARVGGQTGDVLGASCQLAECAALTAIVALAA